MKKNNNNLKFLLFLLFFVPFNVFASDDRHYNQEEMSTYSIPDSISGDTFYVDANYGDDANDGLTPETAYKTLAKTFNRYNSNNVRGGDVVKIKAGIYRETINLTMVSAQSDSLSENNPLIIGPYGDGEVIIDPSKTPLSWSAYDSNIFVADWTFVDPPWAVILNDDFKVCRDKQSLTELTRYGLWYYDSISDKVYINTSGVNPMDLDVIVTYYNRSAEHYGIKINGNSYIHIYGLTIRGASRYGITDYPGTGEGVRIEKCTIEFNNNTGIRLFGSDSSIVKNHVWGNVLYNWPRGRTWAANGGWGQGLTISNNGLASGNIVHDNGGEGMGNYGGGGYTIFEDNISKNNWSVGIYIGNAPYCVARRNFVYSDNPDHSEVVEAWQLPQWIQDGGQGAIDSNIERIQVRMRQEGILIGDETATNPIAQSIGHEIYNNIIVGTRRGFSTYSQASGSGLKEYVIANNTIVLPSVSSAYGEFAGMDIHSSNVNNTGTIIKNNIVYSPTPEPIIHADEGDFIGISLDNNLYYTTSSNETPFRIGSYPDQVDYSFDNWKTNTSQDSSTIYDSPLFVGNIGSSEFEDYKLTSNSPAIDMADILLNYSTDFNFSNRGASWDIGAYEYSSEPLIIRADVNQDSQINTTDAMLVLRNSLGLDMTGTAWQASDTTGDVNCDGSSNLSDALLLLKYSLGLDMSGTGWCE